MPKKPTTRIGENEGKGKVGIEYIMISNSYITLEGLNITWQGFVQQLFRDTPPIVLKVFSKSKVNANNTTQGLIFKF